MFRFHDNLPEVYINESRDFQLLARLSDVLFSGVKYDIDSIVNILDAAEIKDRMLELLCSRVGFFPTIDIDAQVLKHIIAAFPYILKNKGTKKGIEAAVNAILKAENTYGDTNNILINIINKSDNILLPYTIYIQTEIKIFNKAALKEVLKYVIPAGYNYYIQVYKKATDAFRDPTIFNQEDTIRVAKMSEMYQASIRAPQTRLTPGYEDIANAYDISAIAGPLTSKHTFDSDLGIEEVYSTPVSDEAEDDNLLDS